MTKAVFTRKSDTGILRSRRSATISRIIATSSKFSNEKTPRATSVVYAAAGFEAEAQKLAQAVPGGASVAKLDWKAPFEIVVGIGATAMK